MLVALISTTRISCNGFASRGTQGCKISIGRGDISYVTVMKAVANSLADNVWTQLQLQYKLKVKLSKVLSDFIVVANRAEQYVTTT